MASIINASTLAPGLVHSGDASGVLQLQSDGVTGVTVGAGGLVTAANGIVMSPMSLGTPITGEFEYDGRVPYFTPLDTQRGLIPGMQFYFLNTPIVNPNTTSTYSIYGVSVNLSSSTVYQFEGLFALLRSGGSTGYALNMGFGGTVTTNSVLYQVHMVYQGSTIPVIDTSNVISLVNTTEMTAITPSASVGVGTAYIKGMISVNAGGTFSPQYSCSAAPGGTMTCQTGSYFAIYPVGAAGSNISVGSWA